MPQLKKVPTALGISDKKYVADDKDRNKIAGAEGPRV